MTKCGKILQRIDIMIIGYILLLVKERRLTISFGKKTIIDIPYGQEKEVKVKVQKVKTNQITCMRCGHIWTPRVEQVRACPKCKSPYFDVERKKR